MGLKIIDFKIPVEFKPMKGFVGGFRSQWVSGQTDTHKFGLDSGAGLGNPCLTFWVQDLKTNKTTYFTADVSNLVEQAVDLVGAGHEGN